MSNKVYYFNGGFYNTEIHGDDIPVGAVEITEEYWLELLAAQTDGKEIKTDEKGYPVAVEKEPPQTKEVRTFSKFGIWVATQDMPLTLPDGTSSNVWAEFESFMRNTKLEKGETLYSGWKNLNDLVEDNKFFEEFYPKAVETFGKELVDNVLAASVVGTKTVIVEG